MSKAWLSAIPAILLSAALSGAGYVEERAAAVELIGNKEYDRAFKKLSGLPGAKLNKIQKSDAMELAVNCLIQQERYDRAMKLAKQIPLEFVANICAMRVLSRRGKYERIVRVLGNADIQTWPPCRRGQAYNLRGEAAYRAGNGKLAVADLKQAIVYADTLDHPKNDRGNIYQTLAQTYSEVLNNEEKAVEVYSKIVALGEQGQLRGSGYLRALINKAQYLREQGEYEAALELLKKPALYGRPGSYWYCTGRIAIGRTHQAAGRKQKAEAVYRELAQNDAIHDRYRKEARQALERLRSAGE